jgi:hypothetical protein
LAPRAYRKPMGKLLGSCRKPLGKLLEAYREPLGKLLGKLVRACRKLL